MPSSTDFFNYSRIYKRLTRRYAAILTLLPAGEPDLAAIQVCYAALADQYPNIADRLRVLRQLVLQRLIELDCSQVDGALFCVTTAMTALAEFTLDCAYQTAKPQLVAKYGQPLTADGSPCEFWIVGMGKLGAKELNVSSDIDLIYVYQQDGNTQGNQDGQQQISNQEFFSHLVKEISRLIDAVTEYGFVFRVDLALRPNGSEGTVAISLPALHTYFKKQGREWERFAWLKSRIVAPQAALFDGSKQQLQQIVYPFVYRKYLDFNMLESMRDLYQKIRQQKIQQGAQYPNRANDIKLFRGGIREIEFSVQLFQVIRGGTYPELRTRATLDALKILHQLDLITTNAAKKLADAYIFYRNIEHRIQYLDDQQTHLLPSQAADLTWLANSLGFADVDSFKQQISYYQDYVTSYSDGLLENNIAQPATRKIDLVQANTNPLEIKDFESPPQLDLALQTLSAEGQQQITNWLNSNRVKNQPDVVKEVLQELLERSIYTINQQYITEKTLPRLLSWLDIVLRKTTYLMMLYERPKVHHRLLKLLDSARWTLVYLKQHPRVIDELSRDNFLSQRFNATKFMQLLQQRKAALQESLEDDEESLLNLLRVAHKTETFKTLARDLEGYLSVEQVADDLSLLADTLLTVVVDWSRQFIKNRHLINTDLAIIAYGKLGGKELGYGSDLDIVFLYEDSVENQEVYFTWVRKIINWLTVKTSEGDLFEIDTALRPNGNSGLLTTSFASFADYQINRGSNVAWLWEHQAITRARCAVGSALLQQQFDQVRQQVLQSPRRAEILKQEILAMRHKIVQNNKVKTNSFNLKHGRGGMIDIEFVAQYLVLLHSAKYPEFLANLGNIALLQIAEQLQIVAPTVGEQAAQAYRFYRKLQHTARLDELSLEIDFATAEPARAAVARLWQEVFAESLAINTA